MSFCGIRLKPVLAADNFWGLAALLWIGSGLMRAFGGLEKGSGFYLSSPFFWLKMALWVGVFVLELYPMIRLIQVRVRQEQTLPETQARLFARLSYLELLLVVAMIFCASAMARGYGF